MKSIKFLTVSLWCFIFIQPVFAQEYEDEEIQFEPIHSTLFPSSSLFKFEEGYEKNSSVIISDDALILKSKKSETASAIAKHGLPINFNQDFSISLTLLGKYLYIPTLVGVAKPFTLEITLNDYTFIISKKSVMLVTGNASNQSPKYLFKTEKKWKLPVNSIGDLLLIKIERHRKNLTLFINNEYVGEAIIQNSSPRDSTAFCLSYTSKSGEITLSSISLDQGSADDEDE